MKDKNTIKQTLKLCASLNQICFFYKLVIRGMTHQALGMLQKMSGSTDAERVSFDAEGLSPDTEGSLLI